MSGKDVGLLILIGSPPKDSDLSRKLVEKLSTRDSKAMAGKLSLKTEAEAQTHGEGSTVCAGTQ